MTAAAQRLLSPEQRARLAELEDAVRVGGAAAVLAGRALAEIRDTGLHLGTHETFEGYARERFGFSRARAYQLIDYAAAAAEFEARGLYLPPERVTRALGGVVPDDYQLVIDVTKSITGKARPSSADVQGVADTVRALAAGAHVEHPDTGQPVHLAHVPPERRVEAIARAAQRGAQDRTQHQSATPQGAAEDVRPLDWVDGLRAVGDIDLIGTPEGWQLVATDRSSGERREGPQRPTLWDAIRHARSAWEGEQP